MTQWEESCRDPIDDRGFFADVVRQTMAVDLSDLIEPARPRQRRTKLTGKPEGSIPAPADKAAVLAMVDQLEAEATDEERRKQNVLEIAHSEGMTQWAAAIAHWMQSTSTNRVHFTDLCQSSGLSRSEVWLGVLFGEFELQQLGEFYSDAFWIKQASSGA